jgi:hypothetical protein
MPKINQIVPNMFFIEEYKIKSTTFINDTFCLLLFLKHFITQIGPKFQTLISNWFDAEVAEKFLNGI